MISSTSSQHQSRRVLHQGQGVQCTIYLTERDGRQVAVKDYSATPWFFRTFIAPYLIRRETRALRVLQGIPGVPQLWVRVGRLAFALEYVEGKPISEIAPDQLDNALLQRVQQTIDAIHARQVSHGDLKRRTNFLVTPQKEVVVIDYASAVIGGRWWRPVTNWVQRQMAQIDNKAVAKIKKLGAPELLTEAEHDLLNNPTGVEKWARKLLKR